MTRPSSEARRRNLLDEAIRQFGEHGYEGSSLDAVASACGVRKQTLLYYFPTKDALLQAAIHATSTRLAEELTEAVVQVKKNKAVAIMRTIFRLAEEWPEFPAFLREASRLGPAVVEQFAAPLEPLRVRAIKAMKEAMDAGELRRQDPELLLFTLYTAVVGSITEAGVLHAVVGDDEGRTALKRRQREVIAFVRSAMQPPTAEERAPRKQA